MKLPGTSSPSCSTPSPPTTDAAPPPAQGTDHGASTVGIHGHGAFSAKLSAKAAFGAAIIALATGVPVTKIAPEGTYVVQRQIAGNGVLTGLAVAKLKAHGLGTVCLSYTEKPGKFVVGSSFVPMSGKPEALGGTGQAARWRLEVSLKQTSLSGSNVVEDFGAGGSEQASTGKPRGLTAACKHLAALKH